MKKENELPLSKKDYFPKSRMEAFSDGVFAILITLLVLELKSPTLKEISNSKELFDNLLELGPKFLMAFISFFTICVIWVNHYRFFKHFKVIDHSILWLNALLLLTVTFLPFPTAVLGDYPHNITSILLYGGTMTSMTLVFAFMKIYAIREGKMFDDSIDPEKFKKNPRRSLYYMRHPFIYLIGTLLCFVSIYISYAVFILMPIYHMEPHVSDLSRR